MEKQYTEPKFQIRWVVVIVIVIFLLWGISGYVLYPYKERGTFGDMFGAVNSLFSGLAFAGIILAILLQRIELRLQRIELEQTREELKGQKEQFILQNETLRKQNFENTFFQMLSLHQQMVSGLEAPHISAQRLVRGRECFITFHERFRKEYKNVETDEDREAINTSFDKFYRGMQGYVNHYYKGLANIFLFVDESSVDDKNFYARIIKGQLSDHELVMLFYYCVSSIGRDRFKEFIVRYNLFEELNKFFLIRQSHAAVIEKLETGKH